MVLQSSALVVLSALSLYQLKEPKGQYVILAETETQHFSLQESQLPLIKSDLEERTKIKFNFVETENFEFFISEKIAPIAQFRDTAKWLEKASQNSSNQFDLSTLEGQALAEFINGLSPSGGIEAKSTDKYLSLSLGLVVHDPSGKLSPFSAELGNSESKPDYPFEKLLRTPKEIELAVERAKSNHKLFPSTYAETKFSVVDLSDTRSKKKYGEAMVALGEAFKSLGEELVKAQSEYVNAYDELMKSIVAKFFPGQDGESPGERNFNDMPQFLRDHLNRLAAGSPELLGFASAQEAEAYLAQNPKLYIQTNLAITKTTRQGIESDSKAGEQSTVFIITRPKRTS